jgi:adenosylhomocysteinase
VCEVEPFAALEAYHDGFDVRPIVEACADAHVVLTATGVRHALGQDAVDALPDGALLANAGGIDDEFDVPALRASATETQRVREHVEELRFAEGRSVFVVGEGVCVNLSAGEGHPAEIMDLTFSVQALSAAYLLQNGRDMTAAVHTLPAEIDEAIAREKLKALGLRIDALTPEQEAFLHAWEAFA